MVCASHGAYELPPDSGPPLPDILLQASGNRGVTSKILNTMLK